MHHILMSHILDLTGSGKTAAFTIPLLCYMLQLPREFTTRCDKEGPLAVVMAPTR